MSRYIDADGFFETFEELDKEPYTTYPASEVRENVRGEWIVKKDIINCSVCKRCSWSKSYEDLVRSFNFCPNCGADMKGGKHG